jgi:uncharacterized membrane protein
MEARAMRRLRDLRGPLLVGALLALCSWAVISFVHVFANWLLGDARAYEAWGNLATNHALPYRDFNVEYPPGALPAFILPIYLHKLSGYHGSYFDWLRVELLLLQLGCLVAMASALLRLGASRTRAYRALAVAGAGSGILGPISFFHYDWWPAFLAVAALAALLAGRGVLACGLAAAGAAAKVFPILLIPFALAELWRHGRWRAVVLGTSVAVAVLVAAVAPFAVLAPHGLGWAIHRELRRPLEVESVGTSIFVAAHQLGAYDLHAVFQAGSRNIAGPGPHAAVRLLSVLTVLALVAVFVLWLRSRRGGEELVLAVCAAVVAYVVFSKVFSPQYLIWLLPLVPLVGGRVGVRATGLLVVILAVTQIFEPYRWWQYWHFSTPWLDWLVVGRNVLVVALLAVLVEPLVRAARARRGASVPALQTE